MFEIAMYVMAAFGFFAMALMAYHGYQKYAPTFSAWWGKEKAVVSAVETRLSDFEARLKGFETTIQGDLTVLHNRLAPIETEIAALKAKVP